MGPGGEVRRRTWLDQIECLLLGRSPSVGTRVQLREECRQVATLLRAGASKTVIRDLRRHGYCEPRLALREEEYRDSVARASRASDDEVARMTSLCAERIAKAPRAYGPSRTLEHESGIPEHLRRAVRGRARAGIGVVAPTRTAPRRLELGCPGLGIFVPLQSRSRRGQQRTARAARRLALRLAKAAGDRARLTEILEEEGVRPWMIRDAWERVDYLEARRERRRRQGGVNAWLGGRTVRLDPREPGDAVAGLPEVVEACGGRDFRDPTCPMEGPSFQHLAFAGRGWWSRAVRTTALLLYESGSSLYQRAEAIARSRGRWWPKPASGKPRFLERVRGRLRPVGGSGGPFGARALHMLVGLIQTRPPPQRDFLHRARTRVRDWWRVQYARLRDAAPRAGPPSRRQEAFLRAVAFPRHEWGLAA